MTFDFVTCLFNFFTYTNFAFLNVPTVVQYSHEVVLSIKRVRIRNVLNVHKHLVQSTWRVKAGVFEHVCFFQSPPKNSNKSESFQCEKYCCSNAISEVLSTRVYELS